MKSHSTLPLFSLQPETREILLTQGQVAIVDAADYEWLMQWKWSAGKSKHTYYAMRWLPKVNGKRQGVRMHRQIMDAPNGSQVDHRDWDGLNNCRSNLRLCTHEQNMANRKTYRGSTSELKGVSWHKVKCKWQAQIQHNGKKIYLGGFDNTEDAAYVYDAAARKLHGEFALPNFPDTNEAKRILSVLMPSQQPTLIEVPS